MIKKILVTGANGQLGKTIKELYYDNDIGLEFVFVSKKELDITKQDLLHLFFKQNHFHYCINCAAYTDVEQAEKTPEIAYNINSDGVSNLAYECSENNIVLIHISTDYVFDGESEKPYEVTDRTNPINEYGKSKLDGEIKIKSILKRYFIVRTSWLYSRKYGNNFYKTILKKAKEEKELHITVDQTGCPTNTESLSNYLLKLIINNSKDYGIKHFCDEKIMTWYDFTHKILIENDLLGKTKLVKLEKYLTFARRPKKSILK
ncbi:dTDP-4-dehydrorhamnose reductase [Algibacter sp. R77976]|uniref:dTDP-4-dehydrorhamnose reductase n=1 Tax=Algibacter sp. R77976 TaxID=3093873 RepID=UPI0037C5529C